MLSFPDAPGSTPRERSCFRPEQRRPSSPRRVLPRGPSAPPEPRHSHRRRRFPSYPPPPLPVLRDVAASTMWSRRREAHKRLASYATATDKLNIRRRAPGKQGCGNEDSRRRGDALRWPRGGPISALAAASQTPHITLAPSDGGVVSPGVGGGGRIRLRPQPSRVAAIRTSLSPPESLRSRVPSALTPDVLGGN